MARDSAAESFGKVVLGGAVGFALYLLVTGLGLGGRGEGKGEGEGAAATQPPALPKDEKRLTFVMTAPKASDPSRPMAFRLHDASDAKTYSIDEMIARVKAGGRSDVTLNVVGDVRQGSTMSALVALKKAGIDVWKEDARGAATRVSGNDRGRYGRGVA